ncbi:hypothetical protein J7M23_01470, partial [Candidatus Sumerlaeota bacterium]|nr:hypothetical protein [Candidatus Sumerlaeota bacterium]
SIHADLINRIDATNQRIDETNQRIDSIHADLINRVDETNARIDYVQVEITKQMNGFNERLERLYTAMVKHDEHHLLEVKLEKLSERVERLEARVEPH